MTVKERVIEQLEELDEAELLEVEKDLQSRAAQTRIKRQLEELRLSDEPAAPVSTQNREVFEEATHDG